MAYAGLLDGGLSVTIAGTQYRDVAKDLEWESSPQGDGGCVFWVAVTDPFAVSTQYPELRRGSKIIVQHTVDSVTTRLYTGWILTDPRAATATDFARVDVLCGGALEVAKMRGDLAWIFTDPDTSQWIPNKRSPHCFAFDNQGHVRVSVGDNTKVPHDRAGILGAIAYLGAENMLGVYNGWRRITGTVTWNLKDKMRAALVRSSYYNISRDVSDYTTITSWYNDTGKNANLDMTFTSAGYVGLALYADVAAGITTTDERRIEIEDCVLYTNTVQKTLDEGMLAIAQFTNLATGYDTAAVGNLLCGLYVRPWTDAASALATLAAQGVVLVHWGFLGDTFYCKPMLVKQADIHNNSLANCYVVDPALPGIDWVVNQHPEQGAGNSITLLYGHTNDTRWPAGTPGRVTSDPSPGWSSTTPFLGRTAPVMVADFSSHNMTAGHAKSMANSLAKHLGIGESSGTVELTQPTVPTYQGGTRPSAYIHGGDWIEPNGTVPAGMQPGPMFITRAHVYANTGYASLDVGLASSSLIEQMINAGRITRVPLHKPHRRQIRGRNG